MRFLSSRVWKEGTAHHHGPAPGGTTEGARTGHEVAYNPLYLQQQGPLGRVQLDNPGLGLDEEFLGVLDVLGANADTQAEERRWEARAPARCHAVPLPATRSRPPPALPPVAAAGKPALARYEPPPARFPDPAARAGNPSIPRSGPRAAPRSPLYPHRAAPASPSSAASSRWNLRERQAEHPRRGPPGAAAPAGQAQEDTHSPEPPPGPGAPHVAPQQPRANPSPPGLPKPPTRPRAEARRRGTTPPVHPMRTVPIRHGRAAWWCRAAQGPEAPPVSRQAPQQHVTAPVGPSAVQAGAPHLSHGPLCPVQSIGRSSGRGARTAPLTVPRPRYSHGPARGHTAPGRCGRWRGRDPSTERGTAAPPAQTAVTAAAVRPGLAPRGRFSTVTKPHPRAVFSVPSSDNPGILSDVPSLGINTTQLSL